jgi:NDP-sugar pyrophosphorylase family protein
VYFWEDVFIETKPHPVQQFDLPVIIMAGGFGTRLKPLTNVIPKPLIPIGEKTIIENIFDRFAVHGSNRFYLSVNYKADLIKYYLENLNLEHEISYFIEDKPLGTAGSLSLLKGKINSTFFVSNCDIIIEQDYSEILKYHQENKNEITIVAALKNYAIPYGTIETGNNGQLLSLKEKPELTFKINSGMYILEPSLLDEIPTNEFFHITYLIEKIKLRNGNVGVFPVSEGSWKDIGEWDEYWKMIL